MCMVVNVRDSKYDVLIDRTTIFGNPFKIGIDGDRDLVIRKYKAYFYKRIWKDLKFAGNVASLTFLKNIKLGCWCKPLACHGDVISEFLENNEILIKLWIREIKNLGYEFIYVGGN